MVTDVSVFQSLDHEGKWGVAFDGEWAVGFYGPRARQLAERHRDELAQLIAATKRFVAETCNAVRIATNHPGYDVMTEPCNGGEEQKSNASESGSPR